MHESFSKSTLIKEVGEEANLFLVAFMAGEMVAYALLRESENPPELGNASAMEIVRIYSEKKVIGKGVGSALMKKCVDLAKSKKKRIPLAWRVGT